MSPSTKPRIAIPAPHSSKREYVVRTLPHYEKAVRQAGGEPVVIDLGHTPAEVARLATGCQAVLLPGSAADIDPQKYGAARDPRTHAPDPKRDTVDELLLQDAYNLRKPILGICYGLQMLNVYRTGTLVQHIEAAEDDGEPVKHDAGSGAGAVHRVLVESNSRLGSIVAGVKLPVTGPSIVPGDETSEGHEAVEQPAQMEIATNSSHHQAADVVGDGLRVVARCAEDGTVEALEGTAPGHFVLAVQWHPERMVEEDEISRALFRTFVHAATKSPVARKT
jgi:putative glutamine amidotransferase